MIEPWHPGNPAWQHKGHIMQAWTAVGVRSWHKVLRSSCNINAQRLMKCRYKSISHLSPYYPARLSPNSFWEVRDLLPSPFQGRVRGYKTSSLQHETDFQQQRVLLCTLRSSGPFCFAVTLHKDMGPSPLITFACTAYVIMNSSSKKWFSLFLY